MLIHTFLSHVLQHFVSRFINHGEGITLKSLHKRGEGGGGGENREHSGESATIFLAKVPFSGRSFRFFVSPARVRVEIGVGNNWKRECTLNFDNGINKSDDIGGTIGGELTRARDRAILSIKIGSRLIYRRRVYSADCVINFLMRAI